MDCHRCSAAIFLTIVILISGISFADDSANESQQTAITPDTSGATGGGQTPETTAPPATEAGGQTPAVTPQPVAEGGETAATTQPSIAEQPPVPQPLSTQPSVAEQPPVPQPTALQPPQSNCAGRMVAVDGAGHCKEFSDSCPPPGWSQVGDNTCAEREKRFSPISSDNIPSGCEQHVDNNGMVTVVCQAKAACPEYADIPGKIDGCKSQGGTPDIHVDQMGCRIMDCRFDAVQKSENPFAQPQTCPADRSVDEIARKCNEIGQQLVINFEGGCKVAKCAQKEEQRLKQQQKQCGLVSGPERERIEQDCASRNLGTISDFDANGCQFIRCKEKRQIAVSGVCVNEECQQKCFMSADNTKKCLEVFSSMPSVSQDVIKSLNDYLSLKTQPTNVTMQSLTQQCPKDPPKSMFEDCSNKGGEFVVKRDGDGCIIFTNCVQRGDARDAYVTADEIQSVPDSSELLSLAFKLEKLKIDFDKLVTLSKDIAAYYRSTGSSDAERYDRVAGVFESIKGKVDELKSKMRSRLDNMTRDDVAEITHDVKYIKDVMLKDALYLMLSSSDDVKNIVSNKEGDCGTDGNCFNDAVRVCKPIVFNPDGVKGPTLTISGLENGKCIMKVEQMTPEGKADMTCKLGNYALGIQSAEKDLMPNCEGPLLKYVASYSTIKAQPSTATEEIHASTVPQAQQPVSTTPVQTPTEVLMGCEKVRQGINDIAVCGNECCEPNIGEDYKNCPKDCMAPQVASTKTVEQVQPVARVSPVE